MTDAYASCTYIHVQTPTVGCAHWLVTDRQLPLIAGRPRSAERTHRDPNTDMTATVLIITDEDETTGWLAPNRDRCPLCQDQGSITVREGSLPRDDKGNIDYPLEFLLAHAHGDAELPQDDPIDVILPCPLCQSIDYALQMDERIRGA